MTDSTNRSERSEDASPDPALRGKYLDYCSARVAEVLLGLSSDEMYVLAEEVAAGEAGPGSGTTPSFGVIVRLATERIWRDLSLPTFEEWAKAYEEDPEAFERQMLGLWQEDADTANHTPF